MTGSKSAVFDELIRFHRAQHVLRQLALPGAAHPAAMPLLATLVKAGPVRSRHLADLSCLDPSTISRQIDQLVRTGFVERIADPDDGRATLLRVTDEGRAHLLAHRDRLETLFTTTLFRDWTQDDLTAFTLLLRRLNDEALGHMPALARGYQASAAQTP